MINISKNEEDLVKYMRELKPYEKIIIIKDDKGLPDYYLIQKEQKIFLKGLDNK